MPICPAPDPSLLAEFGGPMENEDFKRLARNGIKVEVLDPHFVV